MNQCEAIVSIAPEGRGGVIFRCTKPVDHGGGHENVGPGRTWPLVEDSPYLQVTVSWFGDE